MCCCPSNRLTHFTGAPCTVILICAGFARPQRTGSVSGSNGGSSDGIIVAVVVAIDRIVGVIVVVAVVVVMIVAIVVGGGGGRVGTVVVISHVVGVGIDGGFKRV